MKKKETIKIDFKFNTGEFKREKLKEDTSFDSRFTTKKETLLKHKKSKYKNNFEEDDN